MNARRVCILFLAGATGFAAGAIADNATQQDRTEPVHSLGMIQDVHSDLAAIIQADMKATQPTCEAQGHATSGWAERMSDGSVQVYTSCEGSLPQHSKNYK